MIIMHVAPFVGAWIEIYTIRNYTHKNKSLRSSERGLKFAKNDLNAISNQVAPFVGAWIEIDQLARMFWIT